MKFKKFTGNYIEVAKDLKFIPAFYGTSDRDTYTKDVNKDLHRICYVNFSGNVAGMQQRLADSRHLGDDELSYAQGNFYGGLFAESLLRYSPVYIKTIVDVSEEGGCNCIGFNYDDDKGRHCGVTLIYLRDNSDDSINVEEQPLRYTLAIIRNVNAPPSQREVVFWSDPVFLYEPNGTPIPGGKSVDGDQVARELQEALHSQSIQKLLAPVLQKDGSINLAEFNALKNRIITNQNIDDRDCKLNKLLELYTTWLRLLTAPSGGPRHDFVLGKLNRQMIGAFCDVNFFKNKSLEDIETLVVKFKNHPVITALPPLNKPLEAYAQGQGFANFEEMHKVMNQSFLKRNQANLIVLGVAILAGLGLALGSIALLPLAPFAVVAGIIGLYAALSIHENERLDAQLDTPLDTPLDAPGDVLQNKMVAAIQYHGFFMAEKKPKEASLIKIEQEQHSEQIRALT